MAVMANQYVVQTFEHDAIIHSDSDKRLYRAIVLQNGMKVLLISDPDTDKSSASLDLCIGNMKDPKEIPGLAHFCEHMLFLGTQKYTEENAYTAFLSQHGGRYNACTRKESTNYYFDVSSEKLSGALDRFAQFFLCPLFTQSATERELNAVNSENDKNLKLDAWRIGMLKQSLGNPMHEYSNFGTGNRETLCTIPMSKGINIRDELLKFYSDFYSSNIMSLVVLGKEPLDELSDLVVPLFSLVDNKSVEIPVWTEEPYGPEHIKKIFYAIPVKDLRILIVSWTIPDMLEFYASNPGKILQHMIGHEGNGSLLSELKKEGWVTYLRGDLLDGAKGFMFFEIVFSLSEEGLENVDNILQKMFQYIEMLRKEENIEWVFKECQQLAYMNFKYMDNRKPIIWTVTLARRMQKYPLPEVVSGPWLLTEYRPDLISMLLHKIVPETMRVGVISKKFEDIVDQKEKWYGTDYRLDDIPDEKVQKWKDCGLCENLHLPPANEFIPTSFELVPKESNCPHVPELIKENGMARLWFKQDEKFLQPKACFSFAISSPSSYTDPLNFNHTCLFVNLLNDSLTEYAFNAQLAGLSYELNGTIYGAKLKVMGFSDKMPIFLRKIMEHLIDFKVDQKKFEMFKDKYTRELKNFSAIESYLYSEYYINTIMTEVRWTKEELYQSTQDMTVHTLQEFIPHFLSKLFIDALVYGNVTKQGAIEIMSMVEGILTENCGAKSILSSQYRRYKEVQLIDGCHYLYQKENNVHKSSAVCIYFQCGIRDTLPNILLEMLVQILSEPCFNILRTREQLGYVVYCTVRRNSGVQGLEVIVQSDRLPQYVDDRVEAFLHHMNTFLQDLCDEDFIKHVNALVTKKLEKTKNINEQNDKYWSEIDSNTYNFNRDAIEVARLRKINKSDVIKFFQEFIAKGAPHRRKMSIHVVPSSASELSSEVLNPESVELLPVPPNLPKPCLVEDIAAFKRQTGLYPLPKPFIETGHAKS